MEIFFVLVAITLVLIWFSRKIIFKFTKGYLIDKIVYLLLFLVPLIATFFIVTGYSQIQMAYQERVPQTITANNLITQGTNKNWLKITEATLSIDKAWYMSEITDIKEAYIPLQASPFSSTNIIVISKNKDILDILNVMQKDDISIEEKTTLNAKLKLYENIVVNGRKIFGYEGNSKIKDEIRNKIGEHVIFIAHDEALSYSNGLVRLLIGLLCILGIATLIWRNRQFITIYFINTAIVFTPLLGIMLGYFIVDGYAQIQMLQQSKAFHTVSANDLIEQGTDKNWLKITEVALRIDKAYVPDSSGIKKAYIPLYASPKSSHLPEVILISKNQEILKIINTLHQEYISEKERTYLNIKLKEYLNTTVNGRKKLWEDVDAKVKNKFKMIADDVIVIIHDEKVAQVPNYTKGWNQLSISLLGLFALIILVWFKRKVYFVYYRRLLTASDTVLGVIIIIFTLIGGTLIVTGYSKIQLVYQEKEPYTITASDLIKPGTDKNWLTITEATLGIDEAWYVGNSSNLIKAYIPLYSSSLSSNIFIISENQDILNILNTSIQDNLSTEEKITLNTKLKKYENIRIYGTNKSSYSVDSKIRDKIETEIGKNVIFVIHDEIPSYSEAGIRLLIGLLCVFMVIKLFRLERKLRPNG